MQAGYGSLLTKWDKREVHGQLAIAKSKDSMNKSKCIGSQGIYMSQTILYPEIMDILWLQAKCHSFYEPVWHADMI